jgi:predicted nucleic acid-binding protein
MKTHGLIPTRLRKGGNPIGGNDLLIAAQAVALNYAINALPRENWLRQP